MRRSQPAENVIGDPTHPSSRNRVLQQLPPDDRHTLLTRADHVDLAVGQTLARMTDPFSTVFFPVGGVISVINEMMSGHHLAIGVIGNEGAIGLGPLFHLRQYSLSLVVLVESSGYAVPTDVFTSLFHHSREVRQVVLVHIGQRMWEFMTAAACNRVHSHRNRLARWLLTITDKAAISSLPVTHETLAQLVGGPRHAVTVALNALRRKGAIAHRRGRIDILDRALLTAHACECYTAPPRTSLYRHRH